MEKYSWQGADCSRQKSEVRREKRFIRELEN
jgi:hypothetical protein